MAFKLPNKKGQFPFKSKFDFSKKADYSKEATEGNFGSRFADAITPNISQDNTAWENTKEIASTMIPVGRAVKFASIVAKMNKGEKT